MLHILLCVLASVDLQTSSVSCPAAQMVTAGDAVECLIELRTAGGLLTGDDTLVCLFSSNISNSYDGGAEAEDYECTSATLASPFYWTGQTGRYKMLTTPTVSGIMRGNIFYTDQYGPQPIADLMYYVQPSIEDYSKLASSCATAAGSVECTTLHRDRFGNKIKECFQRWADNPVSTCTPVPFTATN
eukprot:TRINITY_DN48563_c0_g1_i1.p1 TRINITY_DN48563_c0_g1~~TRINITY_DN48563_c0_g1_i1.p1  ORF type:complete len:187 (+),score=48.60 TRINITY_DN48563_c0_g1_i1:30-590(+)